MAEIDDVVNWQPKQVVDWFRGLDDGLQLYIPNLEEANVTGAQLITLNYEDLENLGISPIGHQVLVLEATELLKQLHCNLESENLQSRALDLNCRCRALRSHIKTRRRTDRDATEALRRGPSIPLLRHACDVLDSSKLLVMWLDRPPFFSNNELRRIRATVVKLSYELSTTVQQTIFACSIEDAVSSICGEMEILSNQMVTSNDVMTIQPAFLEVTHLVNRDPSSGLGLFIKATFEGHHVITGTKEGSISSRIRRITPGDEVVAVGGRNVVGWQLSKLVSALKKTPSDISITLKKRPQFATNVNTLAPLSRRNPKQGRILTAPPVVQPIQKVIESRKNSIEGSVDSNLDKIHSSKENLESPKKDSRTKKKLKKEKAKSSSNILASAAESLKKSSAQHRGSLSQASSIESSLRSASSMEAILSTSTSNLTKNFDLRRSLEKVWKKEKLDSNPNLARSEGKIKNHKSERSAKSKDKKGKSSRSLSQENMMPNVNDVLEELRSKRMRQSERKMKENASKKSQSVSDHIRTQSGTTEPPSSPLDFLVIPPPPNAPYTPRVENVLQGLTDEAVLPVKDKKAEKTSESPNSLLDIEHRRRFTIIGSEQMDDKWFNSLLAEVNAKREKWKSSLSSKQVLERLDETATASEDSVFTSHSFLAEEHVVVQRAPKPKARNRPMSMPPNYYSAAKLKKYRVGQALASTQSKSSLSKVSDSSSPVTGNTMSPVAHQVDANGVKKLAPLNYIEDVNYSKSGANSLESRSSSKSQTNANNNNTSSSERKRYKTPPRPAPRVTPPSTINTSKMEKQQVLVSEGNDKLNSHIKETTNKSGPNSKPHLLQNSTERATKERLGGSPTPDQTVRPFGERKKPQAEIDRTLMQNAITDEIGRYFIKQKASAASLSSDTFSPSAIPSPLWSDNDAFLPRSPAMGTNMVRQQTSSPVMPPVAKPRSRLKNSDAEETKPPKIAMIPPSRRDFQSDDSGYVRQNRIKSVDSSDLLKTTDTPIEPKRRQSEGVSSDLKIPEKNQLLSLAQAAPSSRGSYVAAIDGGYILDDIKAEGSKKEKEAPIDSEGYSIKVIDGVKVKLRKSPAIVRSNSNSGKKGRLKIVDQLRSSPEMRSFRRISCRDLGAGECDGWLWKKKTNTTSALSSKWSKRWVVLKENALYCYHTEEDDKAESYIYLPGYKVTPAPESKKRFAFRVAHPQRKTFYFASDRQVDMSRWMNKLGLAAIEYTYPQQDNHTAATKKEVGYFSESESEEASNASQSENESSSGTPQSSPEKVFKGVSNSVVTSSPRNNVSRHMSTQPDLNRSARYPKNKAEQIKANSATQTVNSTKAEGRNRSKSEAVTTKPSQPFETSTATSSLTAQDESLSPNSNGSNSPFSSPRKKPVVSAENRKHKTDDTRRKQYRNSAHQFSGYSNNETSQDSGIKSAHSEEELRHLKQVAAKKAEEVAKRHSRTSMSSLTSNHSAENLQTADAGGMFVKNKKAKGKKSPAGSPANVAASRSFGEYDTESKISNGSPRLVRRDIAGRPKVKAEVDQPSQPETSQTDDPKDSSIDDLCKALQNADVDIHGVNRKKTLRRKFTILSRDPKRNDLLHKKRSLQSQIKALEGELEYYKLLDDKVITSEVIHDWITEHPSNFAELGSIRKMSKRHKNANTVHGTNHDGDTTSSSTQRSSSLKSKTEDTDSVKTGVTPPVPAKRTSKVFSDTAAVNISQSVSENPTSTSPIVNRHKLSDSDIPPEYSSNPNMKPVNVSVRPRSWAISAQDSDKFRSRGDRTPSPNAEVSVPTLSPTSMKPYLETDL